MSHLGCVNSGKKFQRKKEGPWNLGERKQRYMPEGKKGKEKRCRPEREGGKWLVSARAGVTSIIIAGHDVCPGISLPGLAACLGLGAETQQRPGIYL